MITKIHGYFTTQIFRDVPVYKFNSNNFFSPDNDRKRPIATIALCRTTNESVKSRVYISQTKVVENSPVVCNILQTWRKKVIWRTIVTFKRNVIARQKNNQYLRCSNRNTSPLKRKKTKIYKKIFVTCVTLVE